MAGLCSLFSVPRPLRRSPAPGLPKASPQTGGPAWKGEGKGSRQTRGLPSPPLGPRAEGPSGLKAGVPWVQAGARPWRNQGLGLTRRRTRPPALPKQPLAGPCHRSRHTGGVLREELEQVKVWPSREFAKSRENWRLAKLLLYYPAC